MVTGLSAEERHARFRTLLAEMGAIAEAVSHLQDVRLRESAYYELVGLLNPGQVEEDMPAWGLALVRAYLTGEPLDLDGCEVPDEIRRLLELAVASKTLAQSGDDR